MKIGDNGSKAIDARNQLARALDLGAFICIRCGHSRLLTVGARLTKDGSKMGFKCVECVKKGEEVGRTDSM
jgi:hypothetical protein